MSSQTIIGAASFCFDRFDFGAADVANAAAAAAVSCAPDGSGMGTGYLGTLGTMGHGCQPEVLDQPCTLDQPSNQMGNKFEYSAQNRKKTPLCVRFLPCF